MSEEIPFERFLSDAARVQATDGFIASQNERLSLLTDLEDEELRSAAASGLYEEQQSALTARSAVAETVDYDMVAQSMQADDVLIKELSIRKAEIEVAVAALHRQAEISLQVSPTSEATINRIFNKKQAVIMAESNSITEQLESIHARETGYIAIGAAWTIPRVPIQRLETRTEPQVVDAPSSETATVEATTVPVENEASDNEMVLASVMWSVCEYAMAHAESGVRIEEMRREVPELAQLSDNEYAFFKTQFTELRELIQTKLTDSGVSVEWRVSGRTRGTRYHLETKRSLQNTFEAGASADTPVSVKKQKEISNALEAHYGTALSLDATLDTKTALPEASPTGMLSRDTPPEQLAQVPFVKSILQHMDSYQTRYQTEATKRTALVRELSNTLGIDTTDVGFILSQLVATGLLYERNNKGMLMLSTIEASNEEKDMQLLKSSTQNNESTGSAETASPTEVEPTLPRALKLLRWGRNDMNRGRWMASDISIKEVAKKFKIKDVQLISEVQQWVEWLCANPTGAASDKIAGAKAPTITINGQKLSVWRLAPNKSQELVTRPESKYMRVMYAFTDKELYLYKILDHDEYDSHFLNKK